MCRFPRRMKRPPPLPCTFHSLQCRRKEFLRVPILSDAPVTLNPVNKKTAQTVSELCGRDISKHEHTATPSESHHSRKKHTNMTDDDFMLMLDMQENWDALEYENRSNIPKIKCTKTYDGKEYTLVERIGRTPRTPDKQRQMQFSTEFKSDEK